MEIERINENTVKFFISYVDVEERGFDRDEIWYNREKSEELFWEMMDEVHEEEDFTVDGPLWIQVQALEKGLEVVVTRAPFPYKDGRFEFPFPEDKLKDLTVDERFEELLDHHFHYKDTVEEELEEEDSISFMTYFNDFEDVLSLANLNWPAHTVTKLYSCDNKYYFYMEFPFEYFTEEDIDNVISVVLEYGLESQRTIHYLQEYGKEVISENVLEVLTKYFK
ncbi:adaptor protein MecA [Caldibacillus lycopersici]|uniref:Adapter protein MecA n=1 Tax=Perspicuibacillus lycopersici TaxID=1325689 RepID=A0AAE3IQC1_9BACI|nr:adaptor protein MecA [Perspicuibacillus lycopersici]MCU9612436.1 adaptor protein MecA [Perspicuibacillus lycopersici]